LVDLFEQIRMSGQIVIKRSNEIQNSLYGRYCALSPRQTYCSNGNWGVFLW